MLILGRRSRISLPLLVVAAVVVVVSSEAARGANPVLVGRREGRRGVSMLKDLGGVGIGNRALGFIAAQKWKGRRGGYADLEAWGAADLTA